LLLSCFLNGIPNLLPSLLSSMVDTICFLPWPLVAVRIRVLIYFQPSPCVVCSCWLLGCFGVCAVRALSGRIRSQRSKLPPLCLVIFLPLSCLACSCWLFCCHCVPAVHYRTARRPKPVCSGIPLLCRIAFGKQRTASQHRLSYTIPCFGGARRPGPVSVRSRGN
jgi:hypothetical protein